MSAPRAKGYSSSPQGIQSHLLPHAGALTERATRYFGIDLARLPQMSDHELALFADRATAMTRLKDVLPILENTSPRSSTVKLSTSSLSNAS
jgi:hypothetical protein